MDEFMPSVEFPLSEKDFIPNRNMFTELWRCRYSITDIQPADRRLHPGKIEEGELNVSIEYIDSLPQTFTGDLSTFDISEHDRKFLKVGTILVNIGGRLIQRSGAYYRHAFWMVEHE